MKQLNTSQADINNTLTMPSSLNSKDPMALFLSEPLQVQVGLLNTLGATQAILASTLICLPYVDPSIHQFIKLLYPPDPPLPSCLQKSLFPIKNEL